MISGELSFKGSVYTNRILNPWNQVTSRIRDSREGMHKIVQKTKAIRET